MSLLMKIKPLVVNPELAARIGLNEAIILQQICYWLEETESGVELDGKKWIYNTHEQWCEQFPFWSQDTIKRTLGSLKKLELIRVEQLNKARHDRTNFYAINFESPLLSDECNLPSSRSANCTNREGQNDTIDNSKLPPSIGCKLPSSIRGNLPSSLTETTTETTTEIKKPDGQLAAPADPQLPKIKYQTAIDAYHEILPDMPRVVEFTDGRRDKFRGFWKKFDFTQERWVAYLRYIARHCRWMCESRADNASGRTWRKKNFDYLITERCYLSVKEERANDIPINSQPRRSITDIPKTYSEPVGFRTE